MEHKMLKNKINSRRGFTLVEMIVVIGILGAIVGIISIFQKDVFYLKSVIYGTASAEMDAQHILRPMVAEIRSAAPSDAGAYSILVADPDTFTFYSDIDFDGKKEQVRYFLYGKILKKGVIKSSGNPVVYNPADEKITEVVHDVVSGPIFEYYDENYDGSTAPLSSPFQIFSVRLIKISILVDSDPNRSPSQISFTTEVSIRNLKGNI
jgi:prepilin-type N-terminal cleavage/methylation domain-containing protein